MSAKRRRIREADLVSFPPEVVEVVRKMDRPIIVTEVEEGSILEDILLNELVGTTVFELEPSRKEYQFSSYSKGVNLVAYFIPPNFPIPVVLSEYEQKAPEDTRYIISGSFSDIEKIRELTKMAVCES